MTKKILQKILKILAKLIVSKYQPKIIGITGSVGKTGAKEAISCVLSAKFRARPSFKNYNNEIGLPLTIIGVDSGGRSPLGWLKVIWVAIELLIKRQTDYPEILILEMAADKPGDLAYLLEMAPAQIGVITSIGDSHIENFQTKENIKLEKSSLITGLDKSGWAVLNIDDEVAASLVKASPAKILSYGLDSQAAVSGQEIRFHFPPAVDEAGYGASFKLIYNGSFVPVFLPQIISRAGVYAALAGAAVGIIYKINLLEISQSLKKYSTPAGRMRLIQGVKKTYIIDDTYNASPVSSILAVATLADIAQAGHGKKYAVFGDMLELGVLSQAGHEKVGRAVVENGIDKLIVVGEKSRDIARGASSAGMREDDIFHFADHESAGKFIQERIKPGDFILIKGSQGARMEKIVKEIMADPLQADKLLVRQGQSWMNK